MASPRFHVPRDGPGIRRQLLLRTRLQIIFGGHMTYRIELFWNRLRLLIDDTEGQDLVEYALLAGFVAVAAGALLPGISTSVSTIFSRMGSVLSAAAT
jgi:pilus assembly protein Flp/PilA